VSGRRRRDGEPTTGVDGDARPRVRGAWTTPAVVVRGPDGEIVATGGSAARPGSPGGPGTLGAATATTGWRKGRVSGTGAGTGSGPRATGGPGEGNGAGEPADGTGGATSAGGGTSDAAGSGARGRPRVRPRRIPGAPGAVLVAPTLLTAAADGRIERRARRQAAPSASVTPLPPRRWATEAADDAEGDGDDAVARRGLRSVAGRGSARAGVSGRGARRPAPAHPGEHRPQRVLRAVGGLVGGVVTGEAARARRRAWAERAAGRLQSLAPTAMVAASIVLVALLLYTVFPVRTYLNQRAASERAREQVEVITDENERLAQRAEDLRDPETIEELARAQLGLVKPGEESYGVFPAPQPTTTTTTAPAG
jgi:cell division protein FtsB